MDEQNPALDGAGGEVDVLELEPKDQKEPEELGDDPLDVIQDEVVRAEAKKHRAIARRLERPPKEKKPEVVVEEPKTPSPQEFLTKADYFKSNEKKAIRIAIANAEVRAHWAEIIPFYSSRRGKETPEDILEDINDAITLFKSRNPEVIKDDSKDVLITTPVVKSGMGTTGKETHKVADPPNFSLPTQPKDWYPSKKS